MTHRFEKQFPDLPWRTPLPISVPGPGPGGLIRRFGCRICIAEHGIKSDDVLNLPKSWSESFFHIFTAHP